MCNLSCGEYQVYQEVRKFSRPVIFDVGYDGYPYSVKGTAFLILYRGHGYAITAKHVLQNIDPKKILIPFDEFKSKGFIPFEKFVVMNDEEKTEDNDFKAVCFLKMSTEKRFEKQVKLLPKLELEGKYIYNSIAHKSKILAVGYPFYNNEVDDKNCNIKLRQTSFTGEYQSLSDLQQCHLVKFINEENLDGMSGSPVYSFIHTYSIVDYRFLGIMLKERVYLDGYILLNALKRLSLD